MDLARTVHLQMNRMSHRLRRVPVMVLMPHSRCNCRCIMCDIWKANRNGVTIAPEQVQGLLADFRRLKVEWVLLSGGEPLMHPNLFAVCGLLKALPVRITLLSTGLLLARHAAGIVDSCDDVIVSLDGSRRVHERIRGVPNAFQQLTDGIAALKAIHSGYPVSGRCVLQRLNFEDVPNIIETAQQIGLDHISFLAADVSSTAFNRPEGWPEQRRADVCLSSTEAEKFAEVIEETLSRHAAAFASGFVVESPERMRKLAAYYRAVHGKGAFPPVACNAPWVSAVMEADGTVRPCFFHAALGNIRDAAIPDILNSDGAIAFRRNLNIASNPVCQRCVCTFTMT